MYMIQSGTKQEEAIETVLRNNDDFDDLEALGNGTVEDYKNSESVDVKKTVVLETTLAALKEGIKYPAYLGEIIEYTNAAGRKDMESTPGNLSYVHSEDTRLTLSNIYKAGDVFYQKTGDKVYKLDGTTQVEVSELPETAVKLNEQDEFWGESIQVTKPTGEDKQTPVQAIVIAIAATATIGVGIILIKKFVLKK